MKQEFFNLEIKTNGQKLYEFTDQAISWITKNDFKTSQKFKRFCISESCILFIESNAMIEKHKANQRNELTNETIRSGSKKDLP